MTDIGTIQSALRAASLSIMRNHDIYQIVGLFDDGHALCVRNPLSEAVQCQIDLSLDEVACLSKICVRYPRMIGSVMFSE